MSAVPGRCGMPLTPSVWACAAGVQGGMPDDEDENYAEDAVPGAPADPDDPAADDVDLDQPLNPA